MLGVAAGVLDRIVEVAGAASERDVGFPRVGHLVGPVALQRRIPVGAELLRAGAAGLVVAAPRADPVGADHARFVALGLALLLRRGADHGRGGRFALGVDRVDAVVPRLAGGQPRVGVAGDRGARLRHRPRLRRVGERRRVVGRRHRRGEVVGVELVVVAVGRPQDRPVRPQPARVVVAGGVERVEVLVRVGCRTTCRVRHLVGVELLVLIVRYPHRRPVREDAARVVVAGGLERVEVLARVRGARRQRVGEQLVRTAVGHPQRGAVGPDAAGIFVAGALQRVEVAVRLPAVVGRHRPVDAEGVVRALALVGDGDRVGAVAQHHVVRVHGHVASASL